MLGRSMLKFKRNYFYVKKKQIFQFRAYSLYFNLFYISRTYTEKNILILKKYYLADAFTRQHKQQH